MMAYHNTRSPAAARLTASGREVLTEMELLKEDLTIQVSGCRVPAASLQDAAGSNGVLTSMRYALLKSFSYQVKVPRKKINSLHSVGGSEWEEICKFFMETCRRSARSYIWMGGGWKYLWLQPTEGRFFLLLHICNWKTIATGEKERVSSGDAADPYVEKVTLRSIKRLQWLETAFCRWQRHQAGDRACRIWMFVSRDLDLRCCKEIVKACPALRPLSLSPLWAPTLSRES